MSVETSDEMIAALDCSRRFYVEAAQKVDRSDLKLLFQDLAKLKKAMLEDLRRAAAGERKSAGGNGLAKQLETTYADIKANWDIDKEHRYLDSLVISEDQILHAFGRAMVDSDDVALRNVARKHLESLMQGHRRLLKLRYDQPP